MSDSHDPTRWRDFTEFDAAQCIREPQEHDDKYSRGVLGVITGSAEYPGAAVLGVQAAVRAGIGMVRYLGPERAQQLVLQSRPEVVTVAGRVQAWLVGSGQDASRRADDTRDLLAEAAGSGLPVVVDAGALDIVGSVTGPLVVTPHAGELVTLLAAHDVTVDRAAVTAEPPRWAAIAADLIGGVVLLKGRTTHVCAPSDGDAEGRPAFTVRAPSSWAATAGSGDVLGGVVGALVAARSDELAGDPGLLVRLAAAGAHIHAWAAERASAGGPLAALDIAAAVPAVVAGLVTGVRPQP